MHRTLVFLCLAVLVLGHALGAQLPKPPDRSKDNFKKTTAPQHKRVDLLEKAWARCLTIHLQTMKEADVRSSIDGKMQNEYSEHAAYQFWIKVADMVREDLGIPEELVKSSGALARGSVLAQRVNSVIEAAVKSSGGLLGFDEAVGLGPSFREQHDLVLKDDPAMMQALEDFLRRDGDAWTVGVTTMGDIYAVCFKEVLNFGTDQKEQTTRMRLKEQLAGRDTANAVIGCKNKLAGGIRGSLGLKRPSQIEGFIAAAEAARAHVEAKIPSGTWEKLSYHHTELLKDPKGHLVLLRKESCTLR